MTTNLFLHDYVSYDKYGLLEVRCMACNSVIKSRMEEPSKIDPSRMVYVTAKHSDYREFPVFLNDGTVAFIMVCDNHKDILISDEEAKNITQQIVRGKRIEMENQGKPENIIKVVMENMESNKKVLRRLTEEEIKEKFGGGN